MQLQTSSGQIKKNKKQINGRLPNGSYNGSYAASAQVPLAT
jgi:hypothetical protein